MKPPGDSPGGRLIALDEGGNIKTQTNLYRTEVIAQLFGLSVRRVQQLTQEGIIQSVKDPEDGQRKYDLVPTIQAYIRHLSEKASGRDKREQTVALRKDDADADYKRHKADIASLQLQEMQGRMHNSEDVEAVITDLVFVIRGMLAALPGQLAVDVAGAGSPAEVSDIIRTEVYKVLNELAGYEYNPEVFARRVRDRQGWGELIADEDDE